MNRNEYDKVGFIPYRGNVNPHHHKIQSLFPGFGLEEQKEFVLFVLGSKKGFLIMKGNRSRF